LNVLVQMEGDAKSKYTIKRTAKNLSFLARNTNLSEPEQVKAFIARRNCSDATKKHYAIAYDKYAKYYKIEWTKPHYKPKSKPIRIPTKEKVEMLIANAKNPLAMKLRISMETGFRPVEVYGLKAKDVDLEKRLLYPTTAKDGSAKIGKISIGLRDTLAEYIDKHKIAPNDKLFTGDSQLYSRSYQVVRNRLADKLHDQTIRTIRLYDLRHYYATTLYAKTKDILLVMKQMGHKRIEATMIYTQLLNLNDDEWTCKAAKDVAEAAQLIEAGFEYVQQMDGISLYRKRK
jgi:integrase